MSNEIGNYGKLVSLAIEISKGQTIKEGVLISKSLEKVRYGAAIDLICCAVEGLVRHSVNEQKINSHLGPKPHEFWTYLKCLRMHHANSEVRGYLKQGNVDRGIAELKGLRNGFTHEQSFEHITDEQLNKAIELWRALVSQLYGKEVKLPSSGRRHAVLHDSTYWEKIFEGMLLYCREAYWRNARIPKNVDIERTPSAQAAIDEVYYDGNWVDARDNAELSEALKIFVHAMTPLQPKIRRSRISECPDKYKKIIGEAYRDLVVIIGRQDELRETEMNEDLN